ncbi:MAG: hypothetical protein V2I66_03330 [Halieaceae bacterium]|jgi:hypothetical protein|nr:hypothetical protein [Halieaceae bacterium]
MQVHKNAVKLAHLLATLGLAAALPIPGMAQAPRHGEIRAMDEVLAWDGDAGEWVSPEQFWLNYANTRGGLTWGRGRDYPPYEKVKEGDLFMVEVASGPCLMEFFHSRWRRANDVRRWDPAFNDYGGCPDVFS